MEDWSAGVRTRVFEVTRHGKRGWGHPRYNSTIHMFKPRGLAQTPKGKSLHQPAGLLEVMADKQFDPEKLMQTWTSNIPLGRVGEPHEMVGPALFLASDASSMVTGIVLPVDGGFLSR